MYYRELTTKSGHKISVKRRSFNCAVLPRYFVKDEVNAMPRLEKTIEAVFADRDIMPDEVPQRDRYMDQVLTLFDQC